MKTFLRTTAIVSSGVLLACAFPPFEEAVGAWFGLIPVIFLARHTPPRRAFFWGLGAGSVFWLISLSWLLRLAATGGPFVPVVFGWLLLAGYCALYVGAFTMTAAWWFDLLTRRLDGRPLPAASNVGLVVVLSLLWVGFEYLRSRLFTGFPWNTLGVSQYRNLAVIQVAEWGGVYAVSFVMMMMNAGIGLTILHLAQGWRRPSRTRRRVHVELMLGLLVFALCWMHGLRAVRRLEAAGEEGSTEWRVAAIQPNVGQLTKWTPEFEREIHRTLEEQTDYAAQFSPGLIVWPETAVPGDVLGDSPSCRLIERLSDHGAPLLVGAMEAVVENGEDHYYNSAFLFDRDGRLIGRYRKQHLVLFGEYLPLDRYLPILKTLAPLGISCSAGKTGTVFRLPARPRSPTESGKEQETEVRFSSLICFEDAFSELARRAVRNGARVLINQTNDGWFDGWLAPGWAARQHLSHGVFRSVENRVPSIRSANTGVTCFIDSTGRIRDIYQLERERWKMRVSGFTVHAVTVPDAKMTPAFYTRYGDVPFALPCGVAAALAFILAVVDERRKNTPIPKAED